MRRDNACAAQQLRAHRALQLANARDPHANMLRWMDFSQGSTLRWTNYSFITLQLLYHCFPVPVFLNLKKYIFWLDFCFSVSLVTEVFVHQ